MIKNKNLLLIILVFILTIIYTVKPLMAMEGLGFLVGIMLIPMNTFFIAVNIVLEIINNKKRSKKLAIAEFIFSILSIGSILVWFDAQGHDVFAIACIILNIIFSFSLYKKYFKQETNG